VAVGAQRLIERAITEGTDMVLEGAHLVPGFLETVDSDNAIIVSLLVTIEEEDLHKSHFFRRGRDASARSGERYLNAFKKIRKIQKYMTSSALMRGVPIISHYDLDATLSEIIDHVIEKALETVERGGAAVSDERLLERAVEAIEREKTKDGKPIDEEGSTRREAVP
jgi:2-phosphoglycerate kinase